MYKVRTLLILYVPCTMDDISRPMRKAFNSGKGGTTCCRCTRLILGQWEKRNYSIISSLGRREGVDATQDALVFVAAAGAVVAGLPEGQRGWRWSIRREDGDDFGLFLTSYLGQFWSDFNNSWVYGILDISSKRLSHPLHELTPKMPRFFAFTLILLPRVFFAVEWIEFGPSRPELLQCSFCLNY